VKRVFNPDGEHDHTLGINPPVLLIPDRKKRISNVRTVRQQ